MTFTKLKSGNWRCRLYTKDGQRKSFTAPTKREAEQKALLWELENKKSNNQITLAVATERYIASRETIIAPTTINTYRSYPRLYFTDLLDKPIDTIEIADIQNQVTTLSKTCKPKTINNIITFYLSVLEYSDVYLPKKKLRLPRREKIEYATPNAEGVRDILIATKNTDVEIPVLLSVWCSLRLGEIRGLKWESVNEQYIHICNNIVYNGGITFEKAPKTTESTRKIKTPAYIWQRLNTLERTTPYVCNLTGAMIRNHFHKILKDNNLPYCRFHDLRHANASIMANELHIDENLAKKRGGWTSDVYKNVYVQTFSEQEIAVANQIDDFFVNLFTK